jgi:hypothetical protein
MALANTDYANKLQGHVGDMHYQDERMVHT